MPHIVLETSAGLAEEERTVDILAALVRCLAGQPTVDSAVVKARRIVHARESLAVGEGHAPGFAHLEVRILDGRPDELRGRIADALWSELRSCFAESIKSRAATVTLELREMARATYRK